MFYHPLFLHLLTSLSVLNNCQNCEVFPWKITYTVTVQETMLLSCQMDFIKKAVNHSLLLKTEQMPTLINN